MVRTRCKTGGDDEGERKQKNAGWQDRGTKCGGERRLSRDSSVEHRAGLGDSELKCDMVQYGVRTWTNKRMHWPLGLSEPMRDPYVCGVATSEVQQPGFRRKPPTD